MTGLRRASVDIGSNSVRTMVIEWAAAGPRLIHDRGSMTRIGDSIATDGVLRGEALIRVADEVGAGAAAARSHGAHVSCFATAGLRDLSNRVEVVAHLERALGGPIAIVSGEQEALLSYVGVVASLPPPHGERPVVMADVGGGSTELAWRTGARAHTRSFPIGARKLLAALPRLGAEGPLDASTLGDAVDWARQRLASVEEGLPAPPNARAVGVGGSMSALAALHLELERYDPMRVHGTRLTSSDLSALGQRLASVGREERGRLIREPGRADLILPGWAIISAVLECLGLGALEANIYGPRLGILTGTGARVYAACRQGVA